MTRMFAGEPWTFVRSRPGYVLIRNGKAVGRVSTRAWEAAVVVGR